MVSVISEGGTFL
uniref:Uncharacterized protein n=1 Tax=Arundo donax TaxID=35708 RepID=A0A0A8Z5C7_ARUDO